MEIKYFPANIQLKFKESTFLNDSQVDAELYAYLLSIAYDNIIYKESMASMAVIARDILNCKSRQTVYNKFDYLLKKGYIAESADKTYYIINTQQEEQCFPMSLDLIEYFINTIKEPVIKLYIYLGQKYSNQFSFTISELCNHLGLNSTYNNNRKKIKDYLKILSDNQLITIEEYQDGQAHRMRLTNFNSTCPKAGPKKPIIKKQKPLKPMKKQETIHNYDSKGIYGIYSDNELIYIGKTNISFEQRFNQHKQAISCQNTKIYQLIRDEQKKGKNITFSPIIDIS